MVHFVRMELKGTHLCCSKNSGKIQYLYAKMKRMIEEFNHE